ncbi:MAG: hypothetical protein HYY28_00245 [Betaproteobacteria bacterium]|nr:hypothetical protein [Betaproteobacteria bacterium]MBI2958716.1 hypothetical protein [Betaproteobacteria bacterium]
MRLLRLMLVLAAVFGMLASSYSIAGGRGGSGHFGGTHFSRGHVGGSHFSRSHVRSGRFVGDRAPGSHFGRAHVGQGRFIGRHGRFAPRIPHRLIVPKIAIVAAVPLLAPSYYPPYAYPAPVEPAYWYYCASAGAYYPYVQFCPEGWQKAIPGNY